MKFNRNRIEIKSPKQIEKMRRAGLVVAEILNRVAAETGPGVTTGDLDRVAREVIARNGATSSFLGYHGFPAVICTSVNDEVVHGIPGPRVLNEGDIISVDAGAIVDGWHGDAAITLHVGDALAEHETLSIVTWDSMWAGLAAAQAGSRLTDISHSIESSIRKAGNYGILEEFTGHGIGTSMHMHPNVFNFGAPGRGPELEPGMALALEPMVTLGGKYVHTRQDNWTVATDDGSHAAHWEHTVAVTAEGPWVLTAEDGGLAQFAALGIPTPAATRA